MIMMNKNFNKMVFKAFVIRKEKQQKRLFLYIKINSFQRNILDLVSKLFQGFSMLRIFETLDF